MKYINIVAYLILFRIERLGMGWYLCAKFSGKGVLWGEFKREEGMGLNDWQLKEGAALQVRENAMAW